MGLVVRQFSESTSLRYEDRGLERALKVQNRNKKIFFSISDMFTRIVRNQRYSSIKYSTSTPVHTMNYYKICKGNN